MAEHNDFGKEAEEEATNYLKNSGSAGSIGRAL